MAWHNIMKKLIIIAAFILLFFASVASAQLFPPSRVSQGGTGFSSTSPLCMIRGGLTSTSTLVSDCNPTFGFVTASSTATSTFAGGLTVGTNTLTVGYSSGKVGIGTTTPYAKLSVAGEVVGSHFTGTSTSASTFAGSIGIGTTTPCVNPASFTFNANTKCLTLQSLPTNSYTSLNLLNSLGTAGVQMFSDYTTGENYIDSVFNAFTRAGFRFRVRTGGAFVEEALTVYGDGHIGVGSTTPYATLSVKGDSAVGGAAFEVTNSNSFPTFTVENYATTTAWRNLSVVGSLDIGTYYQKYFGFEGDSISSAGNPYPSTLASSSPTLKFYRINNMALASATTTTMVSDIPTQVGTFCTRQANGDERILSVQAGVNDLLTGVAALTTYDNLKQLWAAARGGGCKVIAFTIMHSTSMTAGIEAERVLLNKLIMSDPTLYDYLARPDKVLNPAADSSYFSDSIHPNTAGGSMISSVVDQALFNRPFFLTPNAGTSTQPFTFDMWLNPTGKVSVGTTTESQSAQLTVWGNSTQPIANFVTTASSTAFTVTSAGKVGMGTTSPYRELSVTGDAVVTGNILGATINSAGNIITSGNMFTGQLCDFLSCGTRIDLVHSTGMDFYVNSSLLASFKNDNFGIGTSSPYAKLSVVGEVIASHYTATTTATSTLRRLTGDLISGYGLSSCVGTTNKVTYADGTFRCETDETAGAGVGDIISVGDVSTGAAFDGTQGTTLTFFNIGGNGVLDYDGTDFSFDKPVTATSLSLTNDLTVANGGTGISNVPLGAFLVGNNAGAMTFTNVPTFTTLTATGTGTSTFVGGISTHLGSFSYIHSTSTATSTFGGGINLTSGCFAINGTCVGNGSGGITSIGDGYATTTGPAVTNSTTTSLTNGLTSSLTIITSGSKLTFTPSLSGTLTVAGGGTGAATLTGLLQGNGTSAFTAIANSSTVGQILRTTGASTYAWGALDLDDADAITGTLGTANIEDVYLLNTGDVGTGTYDFSGATFRIPYAAAPTVSTNGDIGVDSTSNQFKYQSGGATKVLGNGNFYPAFTYSTSTAWTGTTTIALGTAFIGETWNAVQCFTDAGTLNAQFSDGTNLMNMFNASTTAGTVTLSTNNTFTASEKRFIAVGTPASSPSYISCTVSKSITAD